MGINPLALRWSLRLRPISGFKVIFAALACFAAALTYSPSPGYTAEWRPAAPAAVGAVARAGAGITQAYEGSQGDTALVAFQSLRFDLAGHRGPQQLLRQVPRGGGLSGSLETDHCSLGAASARVRMVDLSYREVATILAHARVGSAASHSTGPPPTLLY